jgi:WD40 repeat protein
MRVWEVTTGALVLRGEGVPWGFSRDGRVLASSNTTTLAFDDLVLPGELFRLRGHRTTVQRIVWARSSRRLASLDSAFEVNVWEVGRSDPLAGLPGPIGSFETTNAAIALDDEGRRLAYASGGESARALILDLGAGPAGGKPRQRGPWDLREGYDRLVCPGGKRFLLVREERVQRPSDRKVQDAWPVQSVAYELTDDGPQQRRVLRPAEPGDVRKFLDSSLTPDGRYFCWSGPRRPEAARRVEVWEVATGKSVWKLPSPQPRDNESMPAVQISPDGKQVWVHSAVEPPRRYDLPARAGESVAPPMAWLPGHWRLDREGRPQDVGEFFLSAWGESSAWLRLENEDRSGVAAPAFSPDSRFLAWTDESGTVTVADLAALKERVRAFEEESGE